MNSDLNKLLVLAKNTFDSFVAYRVAFIVWRLQLFITFLVFYYLWSAIGHNKGSVGEYSVPSLLTYFIIGYIVRAIVFSTRTTDLGGDIQSGNLSGLLLKPIGAIKYYFARDIVDKLFNLFFMFFEFILILLVFKPNLVLPTWTGFILFSLSIIVATASFFFYSLLISFLAFWSDSAWASRFLFGVVIVTLFSGQFIPLDLMPSWLVTIFDYTPFPYFYYYPLKLWLGLSDISQIILIFTRSLVSLIILYLLTKFFWKRGLLKFQSYGN